MNYSSGAIEPVLFKKVQAPTYLYCKGANCGDRPNKDDRALSISICTLHPFITNTNIYAWSLYEMPEGFQVLASGDTWPRQLTKQWNELSVTAVSAF